MHAQHFAVYDGRESQEVENLTARLPHTCVAILLLAFFVKAVDLGDLAGLVVSSNQSDFVRESIGTRQYSSWCLVVRATYFAFKHISKVNVSNEKYPRSTKSPRNMKFCRPLV